MFGNWHWCEISHRCENFEPVRNFGTKSNFHAGVLDFRTKVFHLPPKILVFGFVFICPTFALSVYNHFEGMLVFNLSYK